MAYEAKLATVEQALSSFAVDAIELEDGESAFARWTEENGLTTANQALQQQQRSLVEFAVRKRHREASDPNPAALVKKNRERPRGRGLTPKERERIGLVQAREEAERPGARALYGSMTAPSQTFDI